MNDPNVNTGSGEPPDPTALERLDSETARRLRRLRSIPVDVSALERRLQAAVPELRPPADNWASRGWPRAFLRPVRAVAASFLVVGLIVALVISSSGGPVLASPERLARVHEEALSGSHKASVKSIEAAEQVLKDQWPHCPAMPDVPGDSVMSCCVHEVGRKKMACVTMSVEGTPVTVAFADAADVKMPRTETLVRAGVTFHVQSHGGVNMAMTERSGRWVCVMGKVPLEKLADLAASVKN